MYTWDSQVRLHCSHELGTVLVTWVGSNADDAVGLYRITRQTKDNFIHSKTLAWATPEAYCVRGFWGL